MNEYSDTVTKDTNTVFYTIYPLSECDIERLQFECLQMIQDQINTVWNSEGFTLCHKDCPTPHLYGQAWFDNSVEDEWYIVWILQIISRNFDVAIKVWDDDGYFVLIEAAESLPSWLTPETSENRLLIYKGRFMLIPQPSSPSEMAIFPQNKVTLHQALQCINHIDSYTGISDKINRIVDDITSKFPERSLHRIRCYLPLNLIHVLYSNPQLISTIISLYLYADSREKQQVIKNHRLDWINVHEANVLLTRCQYAQLFSQRVQTSHHWKNVPVGHHDHEAYQQGIKLTVGAEIALSIGDGDTQMDPKFTQYIKKLESYGYFKDYLEGSNAHRELMNKAELFYTASNEQLSGSIWLNNSKAIQRLSQEEFVPDKYMNMKVNESDSDAWMDVIPDDVQKWFLQGRTNDEFNVSSDTSETTQHCYELNKTTKTKPRVESERNHENNFASELNSTLQGFIDNISSFEGAEVPNSDPNFNAEEFMNCLQQFKDQLDKAAEENSDSEDTSSLGTESLCTESEEEMEEYMDALEEQLKQANLNEGFEKTADGNVDIDLNLVSNILNSFSSDAGLAGPASSVLASLGVHLPRNDDTTSGS